MWLNSEKNKVEIFKKSGYKRWVPTIWSTYPSWLFQWKLNSFPYLDSFLFWSEFWYLCVADSLCSALGCRYESIKSKDK